MSLLRLLPLPAALALGTAPALQAGLYQVTVTVSNPAPADGTMITPVWVGFHDGMFDHFDVGGAASAAIQRIAEDGNVTPLAEAFNASGHGGASGVILGLNPAPPVFRPGDTNQMSFILDSDNPLHAYFSYASMVVPSNDAFIGNDTPTAFALFEAFGAFVPTSFTVTGDRVWDAGTEVNDELPMNTAALGQMTPDTGTDEFSVVTAHSGFNVGGNILTARPGADFTVPGYQVATFTLSATPIPEPASAAALFGGAALLVIAARRPRRVHVETSR